MATLSAAAPLLAQSAYSAGPSNFVNFANADSTADSSYTQPAAPIERSAPPSVYATPNGAYATLNNDPQNGVQHAPPPPGYQGGQARNTTSTPAPGVWLVTAPDASVTTVSAAAGTTELRVEHGRANVNVHHPADHSLILVDLPGGQVSLLKDGLYTFNAETNTVRVLHGEAETTTANVKGIKIKEDHQFVLGATGKEAKATDAYPEELQADLLQGNYGGEGGYRHGDGYGEGFYGGYPYAYGWPYYGFYGPGWGYPYYPYYAFGYPYGYGFGLGFGYYGGFGGYRGGFGGFRGGYGGGFRGVRR